MRQKKHCGHQRIEVKATWEEHFTAHTRIQASFVPRERASGHQAAATMALQSDSTCPQYRPLSHSDSEDSPQIDLSLPQMHFHFRRWQSNV